MRTTLEIPDDVFKKAKLKAVHEGLAFKDLVTRALKRELVSPAGDAATRRERAGRLFAALDQASNLRPVGRLKREKLYDRPVLR